MLRYKGNLSLISSDPTVHADWTLYSPDCKFNLPIDRMYIVSLYPFDSETDSNPLRVLRLDHDSQHSALFVSTYNMHRVEKADRYLWGDKSDILKTIDQYEALKAEHNIDEVAIFD